MRAVKTMGKASLTSDLDSETISGTVGREKYWVCFSGYSFLGLYGSSFVGITRCDKRSRKRWVIRGCWCFSFSVADMAEFVLKSELYIIEDGNVEDLW